MIKDQIKPNMGVKGGARRVAAAPNRNLRTVKSGLAA